MTIWCAQHGMNHTLQTACSFLFAEEEEMSEREVSVLADELGEIHQECNIDGYGDEGAGYDYEKQVRLLIEAGWIPPTKELEDD